MRRKIVKIDESKCNGCGECVPSCVEGAIRIVDGKARLVSDSYCDGLGACLGNCPQDAILIEEREAPEFDEAAALAHMARASGKKPEHAHVHSHGHGSKAAAEGGCPTSHAGGGCPGTMARELKRPARVATGGGGPASATDTAAAEGGCPTSELTHWPVQLHLVAPNAACFQGANLLVAADCVPFAFPDFHRKLLRGRSVVVGCPKLDDAEFYVEKLAAILRQSDVRSLTVAHMEVPCCFGLSRVVELALANSGRQIPLRDITIGLNGTIKSER